MSKKSVTQFFKEDKPAYASYDNIRKLPCFIDSFKASQRKLIWTAFTKANKEYVKSETFANITALHTAYVHGAGSLAGVLATLVQNFPGTCNYQLLMGNNGGWGNRLLSNGVAAPRYTRIKLADITEVLFNKIDREIVDKQWFEGQWIEPKYLIPIYPTILLNPSEGLSTGFASRIYSRDPNEVISYIKKKLNGVEKPRCSLLPWFKDYKGEIRINQETNGYECVGVIEQNNMTSYTITELPIGLEYPKYIEYLDKLCDDKVIIDYSDKCNPKTNELIFEIKTTRDFTRKHDNFESLYKVFKLVKSLPENLTCIDNNNRAKEFSSVQEILDEFINIRLEYYQKRKNYIVESLKNNLIMLASKYHFIKGIVDETIIVNKRKKDNIEAQLDKNDKIHRIDGNYNYLLSMPIHSLTQERMEELKSQIDEKKEEYKIAKNTTIETMWLNDLHELKKYI